jgi:hypothetical protein
MESGHGFVRISSDTPFIGHIQFLELCPRDPDAIGFSIVAICAKSFELHRGRSLCSVFDKMGRWRIPYFNLRGSQFQSRPFVLVPISLSNPLPIAKGDSEMAIENGKLLRQFLWVGTRDARMRESAIDDCVLNESGSAMTSIGNVRAQS